MEISLRLIDDTPGLSSIGLVNRCETAQLALVRVQSSAPLHGELAQMARAMVPGFESRIPYSVFTLSFCWL